MADIVATPNFVRKAKQVRLKERERDSLIVLLAEKPDAGDLIPGTGGARKVRLAREGSGKSGGYRVVTFFGGGAMPVYLLTIFAKSAQENLTEADKKGIRSTCKALLAVHQKLTP